MYDGLPGIHKCVYDVLPNSDVSRQQVPVVYDVLTHARFLPRRQYNKQYNLAINVHIIRYIHIYIYSIYIYVYIYNGGIEGAQPNICKYWQICINIVKYQPNVEKLFLRNRKWDLGLPRYMKMTLLNIPSILSYID